MAIQPFGSGVTSAAAVQSGQAAAGSWQVDGWPTRASVASLAERSIVERARDGDTEAFGELAREAGRRLYGIAYRILRDPDRAEDALQQTLIRIWEALPELRDPDRFDAWSYRLVVHAAYREARRERRWTQLVHEIRADPTSDAGVDGVLDRAEVEASFRRLTPEHRAVLVLHYYAGLPIAEIARVLDIKEGTAASRLHYAGRSFRAAFEADARGAVTGRTT
jgi:RNA polymerase sigma-70 factor, ECF subfamily